MSGSEAADVVVVRRQYNEPCTATYLLRDIEGLHFSAYSGGVGARANREYLCCYVWCDGAIEGEVPHSCRHGPPPHKIKVVIVQKDNTKATYRLLLGHLRERSQAKSLK